MGRMAAAAGVSHPLVFLGVFAESTTHGRPIDGEVVIETRELVKRFGEREALRGVSFHAHRGELLAVIGPNGAGKTTLLSILAGIRRQDAGTVSRPPGEIGWIPQQAALYRRLTVTENLRLFAHLEKVADTDATVEEMLDQTGLADRRNDQVGTLSGGNQQRINIAIGLLARPLVLLLDEPSAGLDPRQRERLWEFVLGLAVGGTTVIFSTHNIAEAERYGQRLLVLADGEALFDGTSAELHAAVRESGARDFEQAFVAFLRDRGH
jgi:ABC-2 type transport system ATP-binding protein